jgi:hypothetical protein
MKRILLPLLLLSLTIWSATASAVTLWDQSAADPFGAGYFDCVAGGPPFGATIYTVSDIDVPASGWVIQGISTYYSNLDFSWTGITQARLNILVKTSSAPPAGFDPHTSGVVVPVTVTELDGGLYLEITASGLNENVGPGQYWIGLTPLAPNANELRLAHTGPMQLDPSYSWDRFGFPSPIWSIGGFPGAESTDAAFKITGLPNIPTATHHSTWGHVKSLYR